MYDRVTAAQLAERVRGLLGSTDATSLRAAATRLGVHEDALGEIVRDETRQPSPQVLAAIVEALGVDATWLLTGEYDPATHRAVEEGGQPAHHVVAHVLDGNGGAAPHAGPIAAALSTTTPDVASPDGASADVARDAHSRPAGGV